MTFGTTLRAQLTVASSANEFYIAIDYNNKTEPVIQALKYISWFLNSGFLVST